MQDHIEATLLIGYTFGVISNLTNVAQKTNNPLKEHLESLHQAMQNRISELYYTDKD